MRSPPEAPVLIVGSDGLIGRHLFDRLRSVGQPVLGTTRRQAKVGDGRCLLDLSQPADTWDLPEMVSFLVICGGVTSHAECETDTAASKRINVDAVADLLAKYDGHGTKLIFFSTSSVFDGSRRHPAPTDPMTPVTRYGKQKAEAEDHIRTWSKNYTILRLTKILDRNNERFSGWIGDIKNKKQINPLSDMVFAPILLEDVIEISQSLIENFSSGTFHFSSDYDISYFDACMFLAHRLDGDVDRVRASSSSSLHIDKNLVPAHSALAISPEFTDRGFSVDPYEVIGRTFVEP